MRGGCGGATATELKQNMKIVQISKNLLVTMTTIKLGVVGLKYFVFRSPTYSHLWKKNQILSHLNYRIFFFTLSKHLTKRVLTLAWKELRYFFEL